MKTQEFRKSAFFILKRRLEENKLPAVVSGLTAVLNCVREAGRWSAVIPAAGHGASEYGFTDETLSHSEPFERSFLAL